MKIRMGFVTNSSSSSFILHYRTVEEAKSIYNEILDLEDIWDLEIFETFEDLVKYLADVEGMSYDGMLEYLDESYGVVEEMDMENYFIYADVGRGYASSYIYEYYFDRILAYDVE